jgi:hypothetical protein
MATKHLEEQQEGEEAAVDSEGNEKKGKGPVVKASSYDTMLHGDSRFWDVIAAKRQEQVKQKNEDPMWGRTVGRRRGEHPQKEQEGDETDPKGAAVKKERTQLETFSIGNEFDFLAEPAAMPATTKESTKDSLMEALNALDKDEVPSARHNDHPDTEEIVFDTSGEGDSSNNAKTAFEETPASAPSSDAQGSTSNASLDSQPKESNKVETPKEPTPAPSQASSDDALSEIDDMDALLASADEDFGDMDLGDFDDDVDDDLEDLENFFKT